MDLKTAIIDTIHYSDIFDYPLTLEELHERLLYITVTSSDLEKQLRDIPLIEEKGGFYFFKGRSALVDVRLKRQVASTKKLKKIRFGVLLLRLIPWIKLVGVTGSVAVNNALPDDDVDLLVISAPRRLWLSRLCATLVLDLFNLRRKKSDKLVDNKLCLNMFLTEDNLKLEEDIYNSYELIQLKPLWWKENTYKQLMDDNKWLFEYVPNYISAKPRSFVIKGGLFPLPFLTILDRWVYALQKRFMTIRGNETVQISAIQFHPHNTKLWILNEFYLRTRFNAR
jgi:hypothetical protein